VYTIQVIFENMVLAPHPKSFSGKYRESGNRRQKVMDQLKLTTFLDKFFIVGIHTSPIRNGYYFTNSINENRLKHTY
jgi:hypothetical protein